MPAITKRSAALASVGSGILLTVGKFVVGIAVGSLAIISEAAHSLLDLAAAVMTLFVVHVGDMPPDANHPYGHARAENLGALAEAVLLVATAIWVLYHAYERIFIRPEIPELSFWSFLVMGSSVIIDFTRARALKRAAAEHKSQALAADAAHFTNDMLGAGVVILSLGILELSARTSFIPPWLSLRADALGAAVVAFIALKVSWSLGRDSIRALMEDVPVDLNSRLASLVSEVDSVVPSSARVRARFVGQKPYVDVSFQVPRNLTLESAAEVSEHVRSAIRSELPDADVVANIVPSRVEAEEIAETVFMAAARLSMPVHHLDLLQTTRGLHVLLDLEVPRHTELEEAHTMSDRLAQELKEEIPGVGDVFVHLEARSGDVRPAVSAEASRRAVEEVVSRFRTLDPPPRVHTWAVDDGVIVVVEMAFDLTRSVVGIHDEVSAIETAILAQVPGVIRVHVDPHPSRIETGLPTV